MDRTTGRATLSIVLPIVLAGLALVVGACTRGDGPVVGQTRDVRPFDAVEVGSGIHVVIRAGSSGSAGPLEVRAQANILPAIATDVSGSTLTVGANDDFMTTDPVIVTIVAPALDRLTLSGGAQATLEDLQADAVELVLKGGSRVIADGAASSVVLTADGGSVAELDQLLARTITVTLDGGAEATVQGSHEVHGAASGAARLTVLGQAVVAVETSGGAQVAARADGQLP